MLMRKVTLLSGASVLVILAALSYIQIQQDYHIQVAQSYKISQSINTDTSLSVKKQLSHLSAKVLSDVNASKQGLDGNFIRPVEYSWFQKVMKDKFISETGTISSLPKDKDILFFNVQNPQSKIVMREIVKFHQVNRFTFVSTFWNFVTNAQGKIIKRLSFKVAKAQAILALAKLGIAHPQVLFTKLNNRDVFGVPTMLLQSKGSWYVLNGAPDTMQVGVWEPIFRVKS